MVAGSLSSWAPDRLPHDKLLSHDMARWPVPDVTATWPAPSTCHSSFHVTSRDKLSSHITSTWTSSFHISRLHGHFVSHVTVTYQYMSWKLESDSFMRSGQNRPDGAYLSRSNHSWQPSTWKLTLVTAKWQLTPTWRALRSGCWLQSKKPPSQWYGWLSTFS